MNTNNCKGCNLYGVCYGNYVLKYDNSKCPCSLCLMKMICNQRCIEFTRFRGLDLNPKDLTVWK